MRTRVLSREWIDGGERNLVTVSKRLEAHQQFLGVSGWNDRQHGTRAVNSVYQQRVLPVMWKQQVPVARDALVHPAIVDL
jgi:hypothetical protein